MAHEFILSETRAALERHRVAKASGSPSAIAEAEHEVRRLQASLLEAKVEAGAIAEIKKTLAQPKRIGS